MEREWFWEFNSYYTIDPIKAGETHQPGVKIYFIYLFIYLFIFFFVAVKLWKSMLFNKHLYNMMFEWRGRFYLRKKGGGGTVLAPDKWRGLKHVKVTMDVIVSTPDPGFGFKFSREINMK